MRHIDHFWASPHAQSAVVHRTTSFEHGFPGHAATFVHLLWGEKITYQKWVPGLATPTPSFNVPQNEAWAACPDLASYPAPGMDALDASFSRFLGTFTAYTCHRSGQDWQLTPGKSQKETFKPQHKGFPSCDPAVSYFRRTL